MTRTYQISVVLLSAAVLFSMTSPRLAFAQRVRSGGESNQGNKEKKKDKDDEHKDKKDKKDQNNQGQGGNQGGNQPNQNPSNNNQGANQNNQDNNNQNNQDNNNQNKQGNNSNKQGDTPRNFSPNQGKSGSANNSGNSNVPSQVQPFIQGGKNQNDKDKKDSLGQNNQGQGGSNRVFNPADKPGFPGNSQNQQLIGGGNAESANKKVGRWNGDRWQGSRKVDNWSQVFGHKKKPFSSEWYNEHPRAWKYNSNKSTVWVVATVPGVYSWLGWGDVPQQYQVGYNNGPRFDPSLYGEWYPLGVYSLMTGPDDVGTRILQLAVDRRGRINGNYYDMITDSDNSVSGEIQQQTQRAEWIINQNPNVRFRASITRLLQPEGSITVQLPGGEQRWQFVRLEN